MYFDDGCVARTVKPILDSLWPDYGSISGGTTVTISGIYTNNLIPKHIVLFGDLVNITVSLNRYDQHASGLVIITV